MNEINIKIERKAKKDSNNTNRVGLYAVFEDTEAQQIRQALNELGIKNLAEFARYCVVKELNTRLKEKAAAKK